MLIRTPLVLTFVTLLFGHTAASASQDEFKKEPLARTFSRDPFNFEVTRGGAPSTLHVLVTNIRDGGITMFSADVQTGLDDDAATKWLQQSDDAPSAATTNYAAPFVLGDYNFDGATDFSVFESMGNVQIMRGVYLYDDRSRTFSRHAELSEIPCLRTDSRRKRIFGECFHLSAANNWTEVYSFGRDKLQVIERYGTDYIARGDRYYLFSYKAKIYGDREKLAITRCVEVVTKGAKTAKRAVPVEHCRRSGYH